MAEDSDLEKTEEPTSHKREKARKEGQIARSRELSSILMLTSGLSLLWMSGQSMTHELSLMVFEGFSFDHNVVSNDKQMVQQIGRLLQQAVLALLPVFAGLVLVALSAPALLGGLVFSTKSIKFDPKKLNPISGLKRIFSMNALAELFKALLKAGFVGIGAALFLWMNWPAMLRLIAQPPLLALDDAMQMLIFAGYVVVFMLIPMVAFDVVYQIYSHLKKLRMTRQEIKDEFKEQEGDPHVKARIRQQQRAAARQRMMADVPKADVIVTNPTHYAVALKYDEKAMSAPKVLAKGAGIIALRIKEIGTENRIPLLEAPPLARALYRHSEVGGQIPATLYAAVAEVLAWIYQLKRWKREGGLKPKKPENLPVPPALDFAGENNRHG
ncbi:flagellar biosynthesis protein FlhB [Photorhabdus antumapuensis]|uniref:flagellar biosynthesis protein FlhB n=1 Tax=Photorhabdus antumapuensis TaxID=2862867 RepID=UPI001CECB7B7|nr:flagellar biosynthesis protein FlhB [Photorhabdus antumapuensis]MCA6219934.1 flagellar type III secretion system protein FlhB [Photorhabdus antumapuensis]